MIFSSQLVLVFVVILSLWLMLVRPRGIAEVWWVGSGAALLVIAGLVPVRFALAAIAEGADVYFFLVGMMLLSALARDVGVFEWISGAAVKSARKSPARLFTTVYAVGTIVTIFLSNDATAVVLTPAILAAVRAARVKPLPYLFACALIANAASFVLPISNPANLIVFQQGMPSLAGWLLAFALPSALAIITTYAVLRWLFRAELRGVIAPEVTEHPLSVEGKWVLAALALVVVVLLTASACDVDLGLPTCLAALAVSCLVCLRTRRNPLPLAREISWRTIALVAALFVMVDAVESIGAIDVTNAWLKHVAELPPTSSAFVTSFIVGIANNIVNNLPLGLVASATIHRAQPSALLTQAILIGVDLGPNLSVTGSLATILWLLALRKESIDVGFLNFLKIGAIAMPVALFAATAGAVLMQMLRALF